jgi:hypothetical protein
LRFVCFLLFGLFILNSCSEENKQIVKGVILKHWWQISNEDTLLIFFHVYDEKHVGLSGTNTRHSLENYTSQVSNITAFRLQNKKLKFEYQCEPSCAIKTICGTRQNDSFLGIGNKFAIYKCYCENSFSVLNLKTGKEDFVYQSFVEKYFPGDSIYQLKPIHPDLSYLDITLSSGKKVFFSLDEMKVIPFKKEFDYLWSKNIYFSDFSAINEGISIRIDEINNQLNRGIRIKTVNNSYLIEKVNESSLFNPKLIYDKNSMSICLHDDSFYVIYSSRIESDWNNIAKINIKGEIEWNCNLGKTFLEDGSIQLLKNGGLVLFSETSFFTINQKGEKSAEVGLDSFVFK